MRARCDPVYPRLRNFLLGPLDMCHINATGNGGAPEEIRRTVLEILAAHGTGQCQSHHIAKLSIR